MSQPLAQCVPWVTQKEGVSRSMVCLFPLTSSAHIRYCHKIRGNVEGECNHQNLRSAGTTRLGSRSRRRRPGNAAGEVRSTPAAGGRGSGSGGGLLGSSAD